MSSKMDRLLKKAAKFAKEKEAKDRTEREKKSLPYCLKCGEPTTWVRYTQFSGTHPYCTNCAKKEEDFPEGDSSYSYWEEVVT